MPVAPRIAAGVALLIAAAAASLPSAQAQTSGRFTFQPIDGGVVRLDSETGHVSHCTKTGDSLACRSVADDRAALQEEIDRLRRENEELRLGGKSANPGVTGKLQLPTEEDLDKAMGLFEKMMRRMMRAFNEEGKAPERL
jgi:hypothetical protein